MRLSTWEVGARHQGLAAAPISAPRNPDFDIGRLREADGDPLGVDERGEPDGICPPPNVPPAAADGIS